MYIYLWCLFVCCGVLTSSNSLVYSEHVAREYTHFWTGLGLILALLPSGSEQHEVLLLGVSFRKEYFRLVTN